MIRLGERFPEFGKSAVVPFDKGREFKTIHSDILLNEINGWTVIFWWPKDFSRLCSADVLEFNRIHAALEQRGALLIGASTDSELAHQAWCNSEAELQNLKFPLLADTSKSLANKLGILMPDERIAHRATFIVDQTGRVRWIKVTDLRTKRNAGQVLKVLDQLQLWDNSLSADSAAVA